MDANEAYELTTSAHMRSADPAFTGYVVGVSPHTAEEIATGVYDARYFAAPADRVAKHVKHFPVEWALPDYQGITEEAFAYFKPLIESEPKLVYDGATPATIAPFNKRWHADSRRAATSPDGGGRTAPPEGGTPRTARCTRAPACLQGRSRNRRSDTTCIPRTNTAPPDRSSGTAR